MDVTGPQGVPFCKMTLNSIIKIASEMPVPYSLVDPGVNLTSYLDSSHNISQYLLIHSKTLKARIKEIRGKNTKSAIL